MRQALARSGVGSPALLQLDRWMAEQNRGRSRNRRQIKRSIAGEDTMLSAIVRGAARRRLRYALVAFTTFTLGGSALVNASGGLIPDSTGLIHGCYDTTSGALRLVQTPADCKATETHLAWNQVGPEGAPGLAGLQGIAGATGPKGDNGAKG